MSHTQSHTTYTYTTLLLLLLAALLPQYTQAVDVEVEKNLVDFPNPLSKDAIAFLNRDFKDLSYSEITAFQDAVSLGYAVNHAIEDKYQEAVAFPDHSFLSISSEETERIMMNDLKKWELEANFAHRSFAQVQASHLSAIEHEFMFEHMTEAELDAELAAEVEWPGFVDKIAKKAKEVGKAAVDGAVKVTAGAAKVANTIGSGLDKIEGGLKKGAHWVTKKTGTEFLNGAIDAGIGMGMNAIPGVGQFRAIQTGLNTAAAIAKGVQKGGLKGALQAGKGALIDAAKGYVMNKIPGGKILEHAMSGPLGKLAKKVGPSIMKSPLAKKALAASQKVLSSKLMKSPLGQKLLAEVKKRGPGVLAKVREKGLNFINDKIQDKTGVNLNLGQYGKGKKPGSWKEIGQGMKKDMIAAAKQGGKDALGAMSESLQATAAKADKAAAKKKEASNPFAKKAPRASVPAFAAFKHAMNGPLGKLMKKHGAKVLQTPQGQKLLNKASNRLSKALNAGKVGKYLNKISAKYGPEAAKKFGAKLAGKLEKGGLAALKKTDLGKSFGRLAKKAGFKKLPKLSAHEAAAKHIKDEVAAARASVKAALKAKLRLKAETKTAKKALKKAKGLFGKLKKKNKKIKKMKKKMKKMKKGKKGKKGGKKAKKGKKGKKGGKKIKGKVKGKKGGKKMKAKKVAKKRAAPKRAAKKSGGGGGGKKRK